MADTSTPSATEGKQAQTTASSSHPNDPIGPPRGADAALQLLKETGGLRQPVDPEASKRLLRKIDLHIMPLICIVYFLQYIDKTAISYASVTGIIESTGLHGNQFNWVASIFFFGYVSSSLDRLREISQKSN
jgi:ACS family allantoate permease-like MFS transporter